MAVIDYYFYGASPFTYLGHEALGEAARRQGAQIAYKPVNLFALWDVSGAVPPAKRPPVRQRYRLIEIQRVADYRGLPVNTKPKFWPVDTTLADRGVIAGILTDCGFDAETILQRAQSDDIAAIRARNSEEAVAADAVGVPAYVLNGEVFWGQDRIELLEHALKTGRAPYTP